MKVKRPPMVAMLAIHFFLNSPFSIVWDTQIFTFLYVLSQTISVLQKQQYIQRIELCSSFSPECLINFYNHDVFIEDFFKVKVCS